ncbi:hypothetical protein [Aeribacillus pallidus]|uniref:Uncharacterized protein n=1 Tax=Aeribacillus pallidus TaxID=33936 RepID=A0A223EAA7_9BACI|nr:hypothetical protein [Aeribacillus pallidus]ASS92197.1 hypothetical protein AP3564_19750 [Aeribacillus pallidus]
MEVWGSVAIGAGLGAIGGIGSGAYRAAKVARNIYNITKGPTYVRGRAAHQAWTKAMKRVVPGGKYDKPLRGTKNVQTFNFLEEGLSLS